jgi:hypothetical protein
VPNLVFQLAAFIRGLLENVGAEIDPILLIRCIKNGLEIPGLKDALIKILQDFHLQISLLEGCQAILHGDSSILGKRLRSNQMGGFFITGMFNDCLVHSALIFLNVLWISQDGVSIVLQSIDRDTPISSLVFSLSTRSPC